MQPGLIGSKTFNVRIPCDLWYFLKIASASQGISMNSIVLDGIKRFQNDLKKKGIVYEINKN